MSSQEDEFFTKLMATFREEASDHLKALSSGLLELEKELPEDQYRQVVETIFREAHSLKGAARSVNQRAIQEICQSLEDVLAAIKQNRLQLSKELFDVLHKAVDTLGQALSSQMEMSQVSIMTTQLTNLLEKSPSASSFTQETEKAAPKLDHQVAETKVKTLSSPEQKTPEKTIRVSLPKLNQLFQEVEETLMIKLFFQQQLLDLKHILSSFRLQEKNFNSLISYIQLLNQALQQGTPIEKDHKLIKGVFRSFDRHQQEIKSSKELLNKLIKGADQNAHFVGSMVDTLLEDAKKILMQPIATLFEAIPLMVRDIARNLSKEVHVEMVGGDIEVDRRILEEIKDPITHLIRNAIDHGIELPDERIKKNKPSFGTIKIVSIESEGSNVTISIADDGRGINLEKIKQIALQKGLISEEDANIISEEETMRLALHSGISTSPIITDLSGRGLGLGIVSEKVDKLGGKLSIETTPGQGTTFKLTLPLTLATFRGIQITVADQDFILPTHNIKRVLRVKTSDIKKTENKETLILDGQTFAFIHLNDLLGLTAKKENEKDSFFALIIKAADEAIVFGVDYIHRECEILVKSLGTHCIKTKNVMACTILEKGTVIPVLNPSDLIKSARQEGVSTTHTSKLKNAQSKKTILLAEDSITTRLLLQNILTSAAYEVKTAVDGLEAFEILQTQRFDLIMTDVEMPRMNGFDLTGKIRSMEKLKNIPIIICSALGSREDRERGIELGANAYLDKNSFNQQVLLNIVQRLIT